MSDIELKPCPFCGGSKHIRIEEPTRSSAAWVVCEGCWAEGPVGQTKERAAERWNAAPRAEVPRA